MFARRLLLLASIPVAVWLAGCSAGNSGDSAAVATAGVPAGIERFLLFPNPIVSGASFQTDTNAYAQAYYAAVDPYNQRETLDEFRTGNGFGTGGQEHLVVFRDVRDLGYGRRMTGRYVPGAGGIPERIAFFVENYLVDVPGGGYNRINVDAAVAQDSNWHVGTNAIEWSCHPDDAGDPNCRRYAKYYNFSPNGQRQLAVNLDGRGLKAMPGPCITCHGGRGDPLEADGSYPTVANTLLDRRGATQAQLHMFSVDTFEWATTAGFTRADQEARLKDFNTWVLCSYPLPAGAPDSAGPNGCTRRAAGTNEWEGTAAALIENAYGGATLPNAMFVDTTVPAGWAGETALYEQVVRPYCRTCHIVRGTNNESDIDFSTEPKFAAYADRIKAHVFDRGNMPLALIVYEDFWRSSAPGRLASYIDSILGPGTATSGGAPRQPGRPIADAGPDFRMVAAGIDAPLHGANSLFASSYSWSVISSPGGGDATIANGSAANATFRASVAGDYVVRLGVSAGGQSSTDTATIRVSASFPDPAGIKFAQVIDVLRNNPYSGPQSCAGSGCHDQTTPSGTSTGAPVIYAAIDRDGVGGAGETSTDIAWLLNQVRGRVNLTEITASPLLRKPIGNHHNGGTVISLALGNVNLEAALESFSKVYYWILNGMPGGGVSASARDARAAPGDPLVFSGSPATASVPLEADNSINASTYAWTIVSEPNAGAFPAAFSNASIRNPDLIVRFPGSYTLQLVVTDGGAESDTTTLNLTVAEDPVVAGVSAGTGVVSFSGTPATGTINLSSAATTGNPLTYSWSVTPTGGGPGLTLSNATVANPTLTVPEGAIGFSYDVSLTACNVSTCDADTANITISPAAGANPSVTTTVSTTARCTVSNGTTATPSASCTWSGSPPVATIALSSTASGPGTLTYLWSVSGPAGASITNSTSASATLNIANDGVYTVSLFVDNGALSTGTTVVKTVTVTANATFTQVKAVFTNPTYSCASIGCHSIGSPPAFVAVNAGLAPSWDDVDDANGNSLYQRVVARATVNDGTVYNNLLVMNPLDITAAPNLNGHGGGQLFTGTSDAAYITFITWIIGGTPNN